MSDILLKPTPGFMYQVKAGDRLKRITNTAYGSEKYTQNIVDANPFLKDRPISLEGLPTLYDDLLTIPYLPDRRKIVETLAEKDPQELTLVLGGREIPVLSASLLMTLDRGADTWKASIPWTPGADQELDKNLLPFKYPETFVYLGGKLRNTGRLYTVEPSLTSTGIVKSLTGYTSTIDLIDSAVSPPYERNNITLEQLAADYTRGSDIKAIFEADTGGAFDRLTASNSDKKFSHLAKVASERGLIVSNTVKGDLLFTQAVTSGQSVGTLEEGQPRVKAWAATYDGRKLFNTYKAIGESPGGDAQTATAKDDNVPRARNTTFTANNTTPGDIGKAAEWQRSKRYADVLNLTFSVEGWYSPSGELWEPNTLLTIISPSLDIPDGVTLLIYSVEFSFTATGISTILKLVPPQVFTREPVPYIWGTV